MPPHLLYPSLVVVFRLADWDAILEMLYFASCFIHNIGYIDAFCGHGSEELQSCSAECSTSLYLQNTCHQHIQGSEKQADRAKHIVAGSHLPACTHINNGIGTCCHHHDGALTHAPCMPIACYTAGAATVKYGSLLTPLFFHPNSVVALSIIIGVPTAYAVYLLSRRQQWQQQILVC